MRVLARSSTLRRYGRAAAMLLLCAVGGWAQAQQVAPADAGDPPGRVARLSYLAGDVGFLPAGASSWTDARINRPLTTADRLSTGTDALAELELGGATVRMAGDTDFGLLDLDDQVAQIELVRGTLGLGVRDLGAGQSIEIDTPTVAIVVDRPGALRVDVGDGTRDTQVSVFDGSAIVYGENDAQRQLVAGRTYRFDDSALSSVIISDLGGEDAFDAWSRGRDQRYVRSESRQYVSDEMIGYQDLDQYGNWQSDADYGAIWYPTRVESNWAPYSSGHWAYIAPWGWSWVDDAAWGFAPYHYGRWANRHGRWGWIPGPVHVRPIYAPALVAFVGGGGWSAGIGTGPVGWFPLGPGEIYNPWYRASRHYYTNVNITNIHRRHGYDRRHFERNLDNHYNHYRRGLPVRGERYVNRHAPRGFTTVSGRTFADGRHVRADTRREVPRELAAVAVLPRGIAGRPPVAGAEGRHRARARSLPAGRFDREVVARRAPPAGIVTPGDAAAPPARRGGQRRDPVPARVRLLTPDASRTGTTAQQVVPRRIALPAEATRVEGRRVGTRSLSGQANARQESAALQRATRDRVGSRRVAAERSTPPRAGTLPNVTPIRHVASRPDALPSARFARSARSTMEAADGRQQPFAHRRGAGDAGDAGVRTPAMDVPQSRRDAAPRPGLSIISRSDAQRAAPAAGRREVSSAPRLQQPPRFQQRAPRDATGASFERPAVSAGRQRALPNNTPGNTNARAAQRRELPARMERPEASRQAPRVLTRTPAPQPLRAPPAARSAPRVATPPPRATNAPASRQERAAPARSENRAPRSTDRAHRAYQQN